MVYGSKDRQVVGWSIGFLKYSRTKSVWKLVYFHVKTKYPEMYRPKGSLSYRILTVFLFVIILLNTACLKEDQNVLFEVPYEVRFPIQAGLIPNLENNFEVNNLPARIYDELLTRGIDTATINSIEGVTCDLYAVDDAVDLHFIREAFVSFQTPGEPWKEAFYRQEIPLNTGGRLQLIPSLGSFEEILLHNSNFNLRFRMFNRETTTRSFEAQLIFRMKVK